MIFNQVQLFFIFIINGFLIAFLFDFFRILRKCFNTKDFLTYIQDFIFWILTGMIILYSIFKFNNGEIRLYIFLAIVIGIIVYMIFFSKHIIKTNVFIIKYLKNIINIIIKLLQIPIKYIYLLNKKIILKPFLLICINIRKIYTFFYKKNTKTTNKFENKEGF